MTEFGNKFGFAPVWIPGPKFEKQIRSELGLFEDALAISTELLDEARDKDRRRDETAAMRVFSRVYSATGRHHEALQVLEEAFAIANELDDTVVMSSLHIRLAEEYLAISDTEAASPHIVMAASERPEDADSLTAQALFESMIGNADAAADLMGIARTNAGEGWSEEDAAILAQYRNDAETE